MPAREIAFRAREILRVREERKNYERERTEVCSSTFNFFHEDYLKVFEALKDGELEKALNFQPTWYRTWFIPLDLKKAERFHDLFPDRVETSLRRADQFCRQEFEFLGIRFRYSKEIEWQKDPATGYRYPSGFYRDIHIFNNDDRVDIKHVWELNRLQFLIEIAKAYYLTGERQYREKIDQLVSSWTEQNPYKTGVAWTSALEVGVRALSLLWCLNFLLARGHATPQTVFLVLKTLYLSGRFIHENLSIYFSPYNHLIGEAAALFLIGYLFPGFRQSQEWARTGWQLLCDQVDKQFHEDGGCVEQATFYHHFTLGFYLQAMAARRLNGDPVPPSVESRIEKALEFALLMTRPDGTLPWIGDIDGARSLYFFNPAHWDFTGFQAIGAVWYKRGDMKWRAGSWSEEAHWLLPLAAHRTFAELEARPPRDRSIRLNASGYRVYRQGFDPKSHFSLIDCGPLAAGVFRDATPSAAHGHADLLSIEIAPYGEPLLIDPGFSNYRGGREWHVYFRSTAAHNTIEIDGASQAQQIGVLNWAYAPECEILQDMDHEMLKAVCAEHDGYRRLPGRIKHRRYFLFINHAFWITLDVVFPHKPVAKRIHTIRQHLHFSAHAEVSLVDAQRIRAHGRKAGLDLFFLPNHDKDVRLKLFKGGEKPHEGWISPIYRHRQPAPVLLFEMKTTLPALLLTVYLPLGSEEQPILQQKSHGYEVNLSGCRYTLNVPWATPKGNGADLSQDLFILLHQQQIMVRIPGRTFATSGHTAEYIIIEKMRS